MIYFNFLAKLNLFPLVLVLFCSSLDIFAQDSESQSPYKNPDTTNKIQNTSSALDIISDISRHSRWERIQYGIVDFSISAFWIAVGLIDKEGDHQVINGHTYYRDIYGDSPRTRESFGFAGLYALMGIGYFGSSSPAESQHRRISSINDPALQQSEAMEALKIIAKKEKRRRISRSIFSFALGTAYAAFRPIQTAHNNDSIFNIVFGAFNLFVGAYNISTPSYGETALRNFQASHQSINPLKTQLRSNYKDEIQLVLIKNF